MNELGETHFLEMFEDWPESMKTDDIYYFDIFSIPDIWLYVIEQRSFTDRFNLPCHLSFYLPFCSVVNAQGFDVDYLERCDLSAVVRFQDSEMKSDTLSAYYGPCLYRDYVRPKELLDCGGEEIINFFVEEIFALYAKKDYQYYLDSGYWQALRKLCFKRDDYKCVRCGSAKNLNAHHLNYMNLGRPGELDDLITLCGKCHTAVHEQDIKNKKEGAR